MSESQSDSKAQSDYQRRMALLTKPMNYVMQDSPIGVANGAALQPSGCSQCGATAGACNCSVNQPPCATCGQASCNCSQAAGVAQSPAQRSPVMRTMESEPAASDAAEAKATEAKASDLPARGLGKKHVYQPKFLPPPAAPQ